MLGAYPLKQRARHGPMSLLDSARCGAQPVLSPDAASQEHHRTPKASVMPDTELSLARDLNRLLPAKGVTVAVAEGSTGGRIGERLVRYAGATAYFKGAIVTYDYTSRTTLLGIPEPLLSRHGAVSEAAVRAMAEAVRTRFGACVGLASTGVAGPTGKAVGELWIALADGSQTIAEHHTVLPRPRTAMQAEFTRLALGMLLRFTRSL